MFEDLCANLEREMNVLLVRSKQKQQAANALAAAEGRSADSDALARSGLADVKRAATTARIIAMLDGGSGAATKRTD